MRGRADRRARAACWALSLACAGVGFSSRAQAQSPGTRQQAAEALFQQGRELLDVGDYAAACQRFEVSQKLDPGLGTLLFLGECYDKLGKSASAWKAFSDAALLASRKADPERGRLARIRASALEPTLPQLRVRVAPATRLLPAVEYTLNGTEVSARDLEQPLHVDPGRALLRVTAPGHQRWETEIEILGGASVAIVDVPELALARAESSNFGVGLALGAANAAPSRSAAQASPAATEPSGSGLRTAGVIVALVGLAGVGTGSYFAVLAVDEAKRAKSIDRCPLPDRCYEAGITLRDDARSHAHIADLAIGIGASLFVGGTLLYLLAPDVGGGSAATATAVSLEAVSSGALLCLKSAW
jgi:tetratricopeptide (TPR) repeat protein